MLRGSGTRFLDPDWDSTGTRIAAGSSDGAVYVFDSAGKTQTVFHGHHDTVNYLVCNPKIGLIVSAANDNTVRCWDVNTGKLVWVGITLRDHQTITVGADAKIVHGDPKLADRELVYVKQDEASTLLLKPSAVWNS